MLLFLHLEDWKSQLLWVLRIFFWNVFLEYLSSCHTSVKLSFPPQWLPVNELLSFFFFPLQMLQLLVFWILFWGVHPNCVFCCSIKGFKLLTIHSNNYLVLLERLYHRKRLWEEQFLGHQRNPKKSFPKNRRVLIPAIKWGLEKDTLSKDKERWKSK